MVSVEVEKQEKQEHIKHIVKVNLAVCTLFYEKLDQTIECIQSFLPPGVNIYVLNNGSRIRPVYVDFDNPKFNCRSYEYVIKLDGAGNIGGCQRQIPPDASFGNIFRDKDPYNSLKMCKMREQMHKRTYPHNECCFCFGNWG